MASLLESEVNRVYERMVHAEIRAYYYGELASRFSRRKQMITGVSFFFGSGAAATAAANAPTWIPVVCSILVVLGNAYALSVGLDRKVLTLARLATQWNRVASDLEHLWTHWYEPEADELLREVISRSRDASELGTTEAPYDPALLKSWEDHVFKLRGFLPESA